MKTRTLKISMMVAISMFVSYNLFAQPASFQPHGSNSSGTPVATEATDSVTIGADMDYFVMPDLAINVDGDGPYDYATNIDALTSEFDWSTTIGTIAGGGLNDDNIVTINYPALGTGNISVFERSAASCEDVTPITIPVRVINLPTAGFDNTVFTTYNSSVCSTVPGTETFNFPVSLATDESNGNLTIHLTIVNTTTTTTVYDADLNIDETATGITFGNGTLGSFNNYGVFTATITSVTDRIAVKSSVTPPVTVGADVFTYTISRTPVTGPIYHLPNM